MQQRVTESLGPALGSQVSLGGDEPDPKRILCWFKIGTGSDSETDPVSVPKRALFLATETGHFLEKKTRL